MRIRWQYGGLLIVTIFIWYIMIYPLQLIKRSTHHQLTALLALKKTSLTQGQLTSTTTDIDVFDQLLQSITKWNLSILDLQLLSALNEFAKLHLILQGTKDHVLTWITKLLQSGQYRFEDFTLQMKDRDLVLQATIVAQQDLREKITSWVTLPFCLQNDELFLPSDINKRADYPAVGEINNAKQHEQLLLLPNHRLIAG